MKNRILAAVVASLGLVSLSAEAISEKQAQTCYQALANAQQKVWQVIDNATLASCKIESDRKKALDNAESKAEAIAINDEYSLIQRELAQKTRRTIQGAEDSMNRELVGGNCSPPLPALPIRLDRRGLRPPGPDPFVFQSLCLSSDRSD